MEEMKTGKSFCCEEKKKDQRKIKNLLSATILLAGLFFGSLFVDVAQLVKGGGFSARNLEKSDVFEAGGKTWVSFSEPAVSVSVINDESCEKCDVSEVLVWMRRILPTVSATKVSYDSPEGKAMIEKFGVKTLPAFVFSKKIQETEFYEQAAMIFEEKDGSYVLDTQELGLPAGKYLTLPERKENDPVFGNQDSSLKVFIFSDYQCPYCRIFHKSIREVMEEYKDKAIFVYKHFPILEIHPQAENAALAADCALEQEKFWEYSDKLYESQADWGDTQGTAKFKEYAMILGLDTANFNQCLDEQKYKNNIEESKNAAREMAISGTPAVFIGDQFFSGAVGIEEIKKAIEDQLKK